MNLQHLIQQQRSFFHSGATLPVTFRIDMLRRLRDEIKRCEGEISLALKEDLGKSDYEGFMCEYGLVLSEISYMIKNTKKFARKKKVVIDLLSCS